MDSDKTREAIDRLKPFVVADRLTVTADPAFDALNRMAETLASAMGAVSLTSPKTAEALADRIITLADYMTAYLDKRCSEWEKNHTRVTPPIDPEFWKPTTSTARAGA